MHGDANGSLINEFNGVLGRQLLQEDINVWGNSDNVTIYDVSQLNANEVRQIMETNNHTVLGWCFSERSSLILEALGLQ